MLAPCGTTTVFVPLLKPPISAMAVLVLAASAVKEAVVVVPVPVPFTVAVTAPALGSEVCTGTLPPVTSSGFGASTSSCKAAGGAAAGAAAASPLLQPARPAARQPGSQAASLQPAACSQAAWKLQRRDGPGAEPRDDGGVRRAVAGTGLRAQRTIST